MISSPTRYRFPAHLLANMQRGKKKVVMMISNGRARKNFCGSMPVEAWLPTAASLMLDDGKSSCVPRCPTGTIGI